MRRLLKLACTSLTLTMFSIGLGLCSFSMSQEQEQVGWLGALFLVLAVLAAAFSALDALFQTHQEITNPSAPQSDRNKPVCTLCDAGPGNARSPKCRCGGEHWDRRSTPRSIYLKTSQTTK